MDIDKKLEAITELYSDTPNGEKCCARHCSSNFEKADLLSICTSATELSYSELGAFVSGLLLASTPVRMQPNSNTRKNRPEYVKPSKDYRLFGIPMCRNLFLLTLGISSKSLHRISNTSDSIISSDFKGYGDNRGGQNCGNKITNDIAQFVVEFIDDTASIYGLPDPGRRRDDIDYGRRIQLPHCMNMTKLFDMYETKASQTSLRSVSYKSFKQIWSDVRPYVTVLSQRSDMCSLCARYQCLISKRLLNATLESSQSIDETIRDFREHREDAHKARQFYKYKVEKAIQSYKNRTVIGGKDHVDELTLSMDFAENLSIPDHNDQVGEMYFKAPMKAGLFNVADEGARESITYILPEKQSMKKCASAVGSMLLDFIRERNVTFNTLTVFADNACGQNKNQYIFSLMALLSIKKMFECQGVRVCFMVVGHTKFFPDSNFGVMKRKAKHIDINTILDIEELILETCLNDDARALGVPGHGHLPRFTNCPFSGEPMFPTYDLTVLSQRFFKKLEGHTSWFDVKFSSNGSIQYHGSPCGDVEDKEWKTIIFANNLDALQNFTLDSLPPAIQDKISQERKDYLWKEIKQHISVGGKIYKKYQCKGHINYRAFTCLRSETITFEDEVSIETAHLKEKVKSNSLLITHIRKMNRDGLIEELKQRGDIPADAAATKKDYSTTMLRTMLQKYARKRGRE